MSLNDQTYQLIESYLSGDLSTEEAKSFEERISNDAELAKELELFKLMEGYISENSWPETEIETQHPKVKSYLKEYLKEDIKSIEQALEEAGNNALQNTNEPSVSNVKPLFKVFRAAAAILLLFGVTWFFMKPDSTVKFANNLEHQQILLAQRGDGDQLFADAETYFNNHHYNQAIPLLIQANELNDDYSIDLALGISYLEEQQYDNALKQFNTIYQSDALIKDKALWYIAMTHLKNKKKTNALEFLERLHAEYPQYNTNKVEELIQKLH